MEIFFFLLVLGVAIFALVRANSAHDSLMETNTRLRDQGQRQDQRIANLEAKLARSTITPLAEVAPPASLTPEADAGPLPASPPLELAREPVLPLLPPTVVPSGLPEKADSPPAVVPSVVPAATRAPGVPPPLPQARSSTPPAMPGTPPALAAATAAPRPAAKPAINLEMFLGARLFAWLGGLAMFLGVIFGIRYAFEHNLISPAVRVGLGYIAGLAFMVVGLRLHGRERYKVLTQSFVATGVLVLYGVTYASHSMYHFAFFTETSTFLVMSLITTIAFVLAVRMNAQVVAILGMVGGFITPPLCSTGVDNPFGLFSYIALLDIGLIAVARYKKWYHILIMGAMGTALMQFGWLGRFFHSEGYETGSKTWVVMAVFCGFTALMTAAARWFAARDPEALKPGVAALLTAASAMFAASLMLLFNDVSTRPVLLYSWVLLVNASVLYVAWMNRKFGWTTAIIAGLTFVHLGCWTTWHVTNETLIPALVIYLLFGVVHTGFSLMFVRKHGTNASVSWMPVITLALVLVPMLKLPEVSFAIWPTLLLTNLLVIGIALFSRRTLPILAALLLTLTSVFIFLQKMPVAVVSLWSFLGVLGMFAVLFVAAGLAMVKRVGESDPLAKYMPSLSAVLPFALLIIASVQLPVVQPSPIFGFGAALAVFLLVMAWRYTQPTLVLVSVLCLLAVQYVWRDTHFHPWQLTMALSWFIGLGMMFVVYPVVTQPRWTHHTQTWIASAVSMIGTFGLVHQVVLRSHPEFDMGLLPLGFAIVAALQLAWVAKNHTTDSPARQSQLAWLGGTTLFFITLIFPLQFDRQWLTIAWALEGAALCWLYLRVRHPGLRYVAAGLLTTTFARLAVNGEVFNYHERTGVPVWNWFLYTYGLVAAAQLAAAYFLAPPNDRIGGLNLRAMFKCFGGVLLFFLMNIEIADAFTPMSESHLSWAAHHDLKLAAKMTYTIAWGLFALGLLVIGFRSRSKATRYTGMGLLGITLLKLFFYDLAGIDGIYRVGALMVVAVIAFAASWLYQRFADTTEKPTDEKQGS